MIYISIKNFRIKIFLKLHQKHRQKFFSIIILLIRVISSLVSYGCISCVCLAAFAFLMRNLILSCTWILLFFSVSFLIARPFVFLVWLRNVSGHNYENTMTFSIFLVTDCANDTCMWLYSKISGRTLYCFCISVVFFKCVP